MKSVFALLCVLAVGCAEAPLPSDEPTEDEVVDKGDPVEVYFDHYTGYGCYHVEYKSVVVFGHLYWVSIPSICNPQPYIFKGDPGPDKGNPWDDTDPVTKEEIMDKFYSDDHKNVI
jgi:hypothetical protein